MEGEEAGVKDKSKWLIIYCEDDSSFSLIEKSEAVFDGELLKEGDKLKFFFSGKEYEGDVRDMGGDADYERLLVRLKDLNAKNRKRETSFHADKPRKNRGKGLSDAMTALKPQRRGKASSSKTGENSKSEPVSLKGKVSDGSGSPRSSRSSSSPAPEEKSQMDIQKSRQEKRKGREDDIKNVKKLRGAADNTEESSATSKTPLSKRVQVHGSQTNSSSDSGDESGSGSDTEEANETGQESDEKENERKKAKDNGKKSRDKIGSDKRANSSEDDGRETEEEKKEKKKTEDQRKKVKESEKKKSKEATRKEKEEDKNEKVKTKGKSESSKQVTSEEESEGEENSSTDDREEKVKDKVKKKKSKSVKDKKKSGKAQGGESSSEPDFQVMRWSANDDNVEEIVGKSKEMVGKKFYVSTGDLQRAKGSKNASTFAKTLLEAAFTDEALFKCSVSGGQYRAGGRDKITQKPALPAPIIALIIDVALHRQAAKGWNPKLSKKDVLGGLRQKLVDLRPRLKKLFPEV